MHGSDPFFKFQKLTKIVHEQKLMNKTTDTLGPVEFASTLRSTLMELRIRREKLPGH